MQDNQFSSLPNTGHSSEQSLCLSVCQPIAFLQNIHVCPNSDPG